MTSNKISAEAEEKLVERLYTQSITRRKAALEELDARFYPASSHTSSAIHLSPEEIQQSVERQVDAEMQRRRERAAEADARTYKSIEDVRHARKMSSGAIEESVDRLYRVSVEKKEVDLQSSRQRYEFDPKTAIPKPKIMSKDEFNASVARMSKPKKREFTIDEVNKIYGLSKK